MPSLARRTRVVFALAALVAAFAAWQGVAAAAEVTGATLEGGTSTSSPGGSVLPATATVKLAFGESWNRTQVNFRHVASNVVTTRCVNTDNHFGPFPDGSTPTVSFNVTAPGPPGDYDVTFFAHSGGDCTAPVPGGLPLFKGLSVTAPAANPDLPTRCGVNVMLILDSSGSIGNNATNVTNAARGFLTALAGTGSQVAIVDFDATATLAVPYTLATAAEIAPTGLFGKYLNSYTAGGTTNWEDAFKRAVEANANAVGPVADLVMFITDGDPNTINKVPGPGSTQLSPDGRVEVMRRSVTQADLVKKPAVTPPEDPKDFDSHVFAIGVGAAVDNAQSEARLTAVSGTQKYPGVPFGKADYTLVTKFGDLEKALKEFATEMCEGSVTITKLVDEGDGELVRDQGWTFRGNVTTTPGGDEYRWVAPEPPPNTGEVEATTDDDGIAAFQWRPDSPTATSTFTATEQVRNGYEFVSSKCTVHNLGVATRRTTSRTTPGPINTGKIGPNQYAKCTVVNKILPGTIEIEKEATPTGSQAFAFTGSGPLGSFSLVDNGTGGSSSRIFTGLAPGTYSVTESVPANWSLTGATCSTAAGTVAGATATIAVSGGSSTVCTFRNTRNDTPPPPDPGLPDVEPPPPPPSTQLEVEKTISPTARAAARIFFSLTVTNVGPIPAENVQLRDVPPGSVVLRRGSLRSTSKAQVAGGSATWNIGTLAPGASSTVRGSVVLASGTPGNKRNHVFASATNAETVTAYADTRVRFIAQRRIIPPVTG